MEWAPPPRGDGPDPEPPPPPPPARPDPPRSGPRPNLIGAVLTGGASRRMGQHKALVRVDDVPMARRAADALVAGGAGRVVLVGGDRRIFDDLVMDGVPDRWPSIGPLGGIATAVLDAPTAPAGAEEVIVLVTACDQPDLTGAVLRDLVDALVAAGPDHLVAAPVTPDGRRHPLPAAWRASAGDLLEQLVAGGARRADAGFGPGNVVDVPADPRALRDVDTPEDLDRGPGGGALTWSPDATAGGSAGHP